MDLNHIEKPIFIVDEQRSRINLDRMASKMEKSSRIHFRPHFKTHQCGEIGNWFRQRGITQITVSSVSMAQYFQKHGWTDILVAVPLNINQVKEIDRLAGKITLHILVDSLEAIQALKTGITHKLNVWIEIDAGYNRTGLLFANLTQIGTIAREIEKTSHLHLQGILTHAGQTYHARSRSEIEDIYQESIQRMIQIQSVLRDQGFSNIQISYGDTPSCSIVESFDLHIDEMRPGNFIFYDLTQYMLGSCTSEDIAVMVACPVIGKYPDRNQVVIYGGGVHLAKDFLPHAKHGRIYGMIALLDPTKLGRTPIIPDVYVISLSQEHGIISGPPPFIRSVEIGQTLLIIPVHSCMTADLYARYYTFEGKQLDRFRLN